MNSELKPTGEVTIRLYDKDHNLKFESSNHNIITDSGDAYIADLMSLTPSRTKLSSANCFIPVGTGWTGTGTKANTWVNTQVGNAHLIDDTYPKTKGAFGTTNDNILQFQVTYEAGTLNFSGINEAALTTHSTNIAANTTIAYAQITPPVSVTSTDILIINWELSFIGA